GAGPAHAIEAIAAPNAIPMMRRFTLFPRHAPALAGHTPKPDAAGAPMLEHRPPAVNPCRLVPPVAPHQHTDNLSSEAIARANDHWLGVQTLVESIRSLSSARDGPCPTGRSRCTRQLTVSGCSGNLSGCLSNDLFYSDAIQRRCTLMPSCFRLGGKVMPRIRKLLLFALIPLVLAFMSGATRAEKRVALVIGNAGYQAGALTTPANDAGLIAQTLQAAGFDVAGARDLDQDSLRRAF